MEPTHTYSHKWDFWSNISCCVFQRGFPANPSQESLSLSISGSGSLHSWNLETTEELSDLAEDSDWLCPDTSVPEEEGTESLPAACEMGEHEGGTREVREKQEEVNLAINGNKEEEIDDRNNLKEVNLEEERKKDGQDKNASSREDPVKETAEKREEEGLKEKREDEQNQTEEVVEGREIETNDMQKGVTKEEQENESQEDKGKELTGSSNKLITLNPHNPNTVEEQQVQEDNQKPPVSPGPQSLIVDPEPPAGQEKRREEAVKKEERQMRQTPSPPKVLSAVARFQSQVHSQGFQVKSRTNELAEPGRPCNMFRSRENTCDSNITEDDNCSEGHEEEDPSPVKVSELKKRFEA